MAVINQKSPCEVPEDWWSIDPPLTATGKVLQSDLNNHLHHFFVPTGTERNVSCQTHFVRTLNQFLKKNLRTFNI
ncbi:hypothetical protein JTB14_025172 [Gonioctena quinquepunctata]|nr:hypothetical protein JTB14_025172 [Gonioctena quinquepunctata]